MIHFKLFLFILGCISLYYSFALPESMKFKVHDVKEPKATKKRIKQPEGEVKREVKALTEEEWIDCEVVRVVDGDTLRVKYNGVEYVIRLFAIDALESYCYGKSQPYGKEAKEYLHSLLAVGEKVNIKPKGSGNHERVAGIVFKGKQNINEQMVKSGLAFVDTKYSKRDKEWEKVLLALQDTAKKSKAGAWKQRNVVFPWEFRRQLREQIKLRKVA